MTTKTVLATLVAKKEEPGGYEVLVFQDKDNDKYLMCTKLPNWNTRTPSLGETGYVQAREFIAGVDTWYNTETGSQIPYCYTGIYFWDFVREPEKINAELIID